MEDKRSKVLIVDDFPSNVEFVTDVLEVENLDIISAHNGKEAIEKALHNLPDLILLDIMMPGMDGYEVCEKLKSVNSTKDIPIIFLTARVQKEDIIKGFELGAVDYIIKPFNFSELISRVKTHLDLKIKTEKLQQINEILEEKINERTLQLKETNEKLQSINEELIIANAELSKLDKAKTEFVLHINHELRTPLNGIQGYTNLLSETIKDEPGINYIRSIESLTSRLIKVAELSLLFTELKTKQQKIEIYDINLIDCINSAINEQDLESKDISIEIENPMNDITVPAESKLLYLCFSIILDNAIKYSPVKGVVGIAINETDGYTDVIISDNGPGFSKKALEQIFDLFSADNLEHQSHGFGIGLATTKIILDLLNGEIEITNKKPFGSIVNIRLHK